MPYRIHFCDGRTPKQRRLFIRFCVKMDETKQFEDGFMAYVFYNPNPSGKRVGDCVIRAIAKLTDRTWEEAYVAVTAQGFTAHDMPSSNAVWGEYLRSIGYVRNIFPNT